MQHAIVTGASGFVGRALCALLPPAHGTLSFGAPDWERRLASAPLEGATVFHLAARAHDPGDRDEAAFDRDNAGKSRRLAQQAASRGARRIVFLSTVKVLGEETAERPFGPDDPPAPQDAYARSKLAAERALAEVSAATGLAVVTVRSPLVLGAGAAGNVESLMRLVDTPWPLPFAAIRNRRSFVHVGDLARLLVACGSHAAAPGRTFIAAHRASASTPRIVMGLRRALGRPERLFGVAPRLLEAMATAVGRGGQIRRLTRSLEVDPGEAERVLGWSAQVAIEAAAQEMASAWRGGWR